MLLNMAHLQSIGKLDLAAMMRKQPTSSAIYCSLILSTCTPNPTLLNSQFVFVHMAQKRDWRLCSLSSPSQSTRVFQPNGSSPTSPKQPSNSSESL